MTLKSTLVVVLAFASAPFATAQLTLNNFSAFESANTFWVGDWSLNNDPNGEPSPRATFSQGAGFYNFLGGSSADSSGVYFFATSPFDITGFNQLDVSARLLEGNVASAFTVRLFDSSFESAYASFATSLFNAAGFTDVSSSLVATEGFNPADVLSSSITGGVTVVGTDILSFAVDNLSASARLDPPTGSAVPEPSTYGLAAAAALGLIVMLRRRSARARV